LSGWILNLVDVESCQESLSGCLLFRFVNILTQGKPQTPCQVSVENGDNDQSEDLESIQQDVLCNDSVLPLRRFEDLLEDSVDTTLVKQSINSHHSSQSEQLGNEQIVVVSRISVTGQDKRILGLFTNEFLNWKGGKEIKHQEPADEVSMGNFLVVLNLQECFRIYILSQKVEYEITTKNIERNFIQNIHRVASGRW
jgi:hypothetical protein